MIPSQREALILDLLQESGVASVSDFSKHCRYSAMSIRRALRLLDDQGRIRRTHGGAVLVTPSASSPPSTRHRGLIGAGVSLVDHWDVLVVTLIKATAVDLLAERALRSNIPVIAEAIYYPGAKTVISIDDYGAGVEVRKRRSSVRAPAKRSS